MTVKAKYPKRVFAVILTVTLIASISITALAAEDITGAKSYEITNPYETVDWGTWGHYKANLHTHSLVSDGEVGLDEMVEEHYAQGYDILAMTDHGCVNRGWNVKPQPVPLFSYNAIFNKLAYLTNARYAEISAGTDRGGRGMTDVPFGIELNAGSLTKTHVNSFFADYGQNIWGIENDYERLIAGVDAHSGLTHINHPGDWLESRDDITIAKDPKNIKFFADILKKYHSCLGIEINYGDGTATRYDRVLWDGLLESVIPAGRNVWGFSNSDAHKFSDINSGFEVFMMPENSVSNVRTAMENGTFFACGYFDSSGEYPSVTSIAVDDSTARITVQGTGYDIIEWVAKGEIIATGNTIDLNAYEGQIGCYVRVQLKSTGGVCYSQAFMVDDGSIPTPEPAESFIAQLWDKLVFKFKSNIIYVILDELIKEITKG